MEGGGSHEVTGEGYINTENRQMGFFGIIFSSTYILHKAKWSNTNQIDQLDFKLSLDFLAIFDLNCHSGNLNLLSNENWQECTGISKGFQDLWSEIKATYRWDLKSCWTLCTKQLYPWQNSPASCVVIYTWLSACPGEMEPPKDYLSTHGCLTSLKNKPQAKHPE